MGHTFCCTLGECGPGADRRAGRNVRDVPQQPSGTVTFLFTDIEGSTRRWENAEAAMREELARHDAILRAAIDAHNGYVFSTAGDAFAAAFARAGDAIRAAAEAQVALRGAGILPVRMGIHLNYASQHTTPTGAPAPGGQPRSLSYS